MLGGRGRIVDGWLTKRRVWSKVVVRVSIVINIRLREHTSRQAKCKEELGSPHLEEDAAPRK